MVDITFHYEPWNDVADCDFPAPLVIHIDSLSAQAIPELAEYLICNPKLRYDLGGVFSHLGARPILIEIGGRLRITERTFWSMVIDSCSAAERIIVRYVEAHIATVQPGDNHLCASTFMDVVGEDALYAYFDIHLAHIDSRKHQDLDGLICVIDCFRRFLDHCDMDHESYQNGYIRMVLKHLRWRDRARFLELLLFRFTHGQRCLGADVDFEFLRDQLTGKGILKDVVDGILRVDNGWSARADILRLCAVVYGSNFELTADVLQYCRERTDLNETHDMINWAAGLTLSRSLRDADWLAHPQDLDTGFHKFEKQTMRWERLTGLGSTVTQ